MFWIKFRLGSKIGFFTKFHRNSQPRRCWWPCWQAVTGCYQLPPSNFCKNNQNTTIIWSDMGLEWLRSAGIQRLWRHIGVGRQCWVIIAYCNGDIWRRSRAMMASHRCQYRRNWGLNNVTSALALVRTAREEVFDVMKNSWGDHKEMGRARRWWQR